MGINILDGKFISGYFHITITFTSLLSLIADSKNEHLYKEYKHLCLTQVKHLYKDPLYL